MDFFVEHEQDVPTLLAPDPTEVDLRVDSHTELFADSLMGLCEIGAITNRRKTLRKGKLATTREGSGSVPE